MKEKMTKKVRVFLSLFLPFCAWSVFVFAANRLNLLNINFAYFGLVVSTLFGFSFLYKILSMKWLIITAIFYFPLMFVILFYYGGAFSILLTGVGP